MRAEDFLDQPGDSSVDPERFIPPGVQAERDKERLRYVQEEFRSSENNPRDKAALGRELERIKPGSSRMSAEDYLSDVREPGIESLQHQSEAEIVLGGIKAAGQAVTALDTASVLQHPEVVMREIAGLGDMVLGMPAALGGTIGETAFRIDQSFRSPEIGQRAASKTGREFREYISAEAAPTWFTDLLNRIDPAPPGKEHDPTKIAVLMDALQQSTDKFGEKVDVWTGGKINKDDVSGFVNGAFNLLGIRGTMKGGAAIEEGLKARFRGKPADEGPRVEPTLPEEPATPPAPRPASQAKADIEATFGIVDEKTRTAAQKARREQARSAFKEDPEYADYLRNYADEEARVRESSAIRGEADALAEATDKASPSKVGGAEGVLLDEQGKPIARSSLDSAMEKANRGTPFLMTAEERIALRDAASKWGGKDVAQRFNRPDLRGGIDRDLVNVLAVGGVGAALAYAYPDEVGPVIAGGAFMLGPDAARIAAHADTAPIGVLMKDSATSLKTLERLHDQNPGRWEFKIDSIDQLLKQQDVSKAERDILGEVLKQQRDQGHTTISAKDLILGFKQATGDFELREAKSDSYANYGIENIGRRAEMYDDSGAMEGVEKRDFGSPPAKTSVWQLPFEVSDANHFNDPRYFGHTRSFEEGGIKHVVEVQSDLVQKVGKVLSEEEKADWLKSYNTSVESVNALRKGETVGMHVDDPAWPEAWMRDFEKLPERAKQYIGVELEKKFASSSPEAALRETVDFVKEHGSSSAGRATRRNINVAFVDALRRLDLLATEALTKLQEGTNTERLSPMLKSWEKRLVREELAATMRERAALPEQLRQAADYVESRLRNYPPENAVKRFHQGKLADKQVKLAAGPIVRFATADTVAKVEGWPTQRTQVQAMRSRFEAQGLTASIENADKMLAKGVDQFGRTLDRPVQAEHQGIYDRYRRDIEKFLKQLGGKPYTDALGHTWIEVPATPGQARVQMFGKGELGLLTKIALVGTGLAIGTNLDKDHPIQGGLLGILSGAFLATGGARRLGAAIKSLGKVDPSIRIDDLGNAHSYAIDRARIDAQRFANSVARLVPDAGRREAVAHAIEKGNLGGLSPKEIEAARQFRDLAEGIRQQAFDAGVLESAVQDYVTHIWDLKPHQLDAFTAAMQGKSPMGPNMSATSPFSLPRKIPTLEEGKKMGFRPRTEDIGEIGEIYVNSMARAMANKGLIEGLKAARTEGGVGLFLKSAEAPATYVHIDHPQLRGYRVHPELVDSLRFMFARTDTPGLLRAAEALNTAIKRMNVSFSLFHAKALFDAATAATANPLLAVKAVAQAAAPRLFGMNKYLQEIHDHGVGPIIDAGIRGGLQFSLERAVPSVEDVGGSFYQGMKSAQKMLDDAVPGLGAPVKGFIAANHAFDNFTWGRLHAGLKLSVFAKTYEKLLRNNPKLPREEAARIAASYTNDLFGGLDWRRVANEFESKWARGLAQTLLNPVARRGLQILMFAPDWTVSTTRAFVKARAGGSGFSGLLKPKTLADLHRQYILRSAAYYFMIGNALNYAFTGRPIWEGKDGKPRDWTFIDLGDGRKMQWSKHTMEPIHWLTHPGQQALNKLGYVPREGLSQTFGVEYLHPREDRSGSVTAGPKMQEGRLSHALKSASPIGFGQFDKGAEVGLAGMAGFPIYGETKEQREERLRRARRQRLAEHRGG